MICQPSASSPPATSRGVKAAFVVIFSLLTILWFCFGRKTGMAFFRSLSALQSWAAVAAVAPMIPVLRFRLRPVLMAAGTLLPLALIFWPSSGVVAGATDQTLQLATVLLAVAAFGLHFISTYGSHAVRTAPDAVMNNLICTSRLLSGAHAFSAIVIAVRLYAQLSWFGPLQTALTIVTLVLLGEAMVRLIFRFYQPARLRSDEINFGQSVLLSTVFARANLFRSLDAALERACGGTLADFWLVRLARALAAPLLLLGLMGAWMSSGLTRIPVDSQGVLVTNGKFHETPLGPGLHLHAPWPRSRVIAVPTARVQEISLGFGRDLAVPVLWTEKHFEDEQNLLVGQGEELLTLNVPVHYRVRDAVAYATNLSSARDALASLGYRLLLQLTAEHTSFGLMTTDRAAAADSIRVGLQEASDRLGLGLEIVFVGLKDVHPPVSVAGAYQDVISAEEERLTQIDQARSYAVQSLGAAQVAAGLTRLQSATAARERVTRAAGETSRFLAPLDTFRAHRDVFTTRLHLETLETTLAGLRQLYVVPAGVGGRRNFILGSDHTSASAMPALNSSIR